AVDLARHHRRVRRFHPPVRAEAAAGGGAGAREFRVRAGHATPGRCDGGQPVNPLPTQPKAGVFGILVRKVPVLAKITGHIPPGQFGRYLVVGVWNTAFGYSTYAAFTALLTPRIPHAY